MTSKTKSKTTPKPQKKNKTENAKPTAQPVTTMAALAEGYVASLEDAGKSAGTCRSYRQDLRVAVMHFGAETDAHTIMTEMVAKYFDSSAVTKTRKGKKKAKPTVDKTRRVLRLALVWAAHAGLITKAPIPQPAAKS